MRKGTEILIESQNLVNLVIIPLKSTNPAKKMDWIISDEYKLTVGMNE